jgi:hypothetical protein
MENSVPLKIAYIGFENASLKTFIIYAVILLFSLGALTVLMTPEDNEPNQTHYVNKEIESSSSIFVTSTSSIPNEQEEEQNVICVPPIDESQIEAEEPIPPVSVVHEEPVENFIVVPVPELEPEPEPSHDEPVAEIKPAKTPTKRKSTNSEPVLLSPRRSERKVKRPEHFDPSSRR